jgi:hypothetical protein
MGLHQEYMVVVVVEPLHRHWARYLEVLEPNTGGIEVDPVIGSDQQTSTD